MIIIHIWTEAGERISNWLLSQHYNRTHSPSSSISLAFLLQQITSDGVLFQYCCIKMGKRGIGIKMCRIKILYRYLKFNDVKDLRCIYYPSHVSGYVQCAPWESQDLQQIHCHDVLHTYKVLFSISACSHQAMSL